MTVILVLATFVLFLLLDYFFSKRPAVQPVMEVRPRPRPALQSNFVAGFQVPDNLRYHPGHTWALNEGPKLVRIGVDDFAARLVGKLEAIKLPQRGQWIRQGQKIFTLKRNGSAVEMVSPVEGVVTEINESVAADPQLARHDPYGDGWLVTVESPDSKLNFRNLLNGDLARWWMEEAAMRLRQRMPLAATSVAQDGGTAVDDLTTYLHDEDWAAVTREFFLS